MVGKSSLNLIVQRFVELRSSNRFQPQFEPNVGASLGAVLSDESHLQVGRYCFGLCPDVSDHGHSVIC